MGGGKDLDEAFRWLCDRAGGGDLLVLRATGDDYYNPYIQHLCHLNSVATLVIPDRGAAQDPAVAKIVQEASALFLSGGDQANYINFWMGTPVQSALNEAIGRGVPSEEPVPAWRCSASTPTVRRETSPTIPILTAAWRWRSRWARV